MKKNLFMVAALVGALALPAVSQGAASVWFELAGGDGAAQSSGDGQALVVDASGDTGTITVNMLANVTNVGLYSANTTLSADGAASVSGWNAVPPAGGAPTPAGGLNIVGPGDIATNFGAATFSGPGYLGAGIVLGTLTINYDITGVDELNINARVGTGLWGQSDFSGASVRYGAGDFGNGGVVGGANGLVISIVPEPATMTLLGLGAIALIRRRR